MNIADRSEQHSDASQTPPAPADELAALRAEVEELKDKNLRLIAEARNAQHRAQRDKEQALRYAESDFARDLLVAMDDFERTLASSAEASGPLLDGVRIVYDQFQSVLRQRGIAPLEAVGQAFDPGLHEALMQRPSEHPAGTVIEEVSRGYRMHDRVIRAARVVVSAGPPGAAEG